MANGDPPVRRGLAAVLTVAAVIGLIVFVAIAINTYETDEYVPAVGTATASGSSGSEPSPQAAPPAVPPQAAPPVGGVATGGGGTAPASTSLALPVFGGLAALALLAAARMLWRPRAA